MRQEGKTVQGVNELMCMVDQGVPQVTVLSRTKLYQDEVIRPRILQALKERGITWIDLPNDAVLTESESGPGTWIVFRYSKMAAAVCSYGAKNHP